MSLLLCRHVPGDLCHSVANKRVAGSGRARDPAESDGRIRPGIDTVWWNVEGFSNDYKETAEE